MKKLLFSMLAILALVFTSCSSDSEENSPIESTPIESTPVKTKPELSKTVETAVYETPTIKSLTKTETTFSYGENNFLNKQITKTTSERVKIEAEEKETTKSNSKHERIYTYNSSNQAIKYTNIFYKDNVKEDETEVLFTYDEKGFLITKEDPIITTNYEYNDKGLMVKKTAFLKKLSETLKYLYEYDTKGKLIKSKYGEDTVITYTFDDKDNPIYTVYTKEVALSSPLHLNRNNLMTEKTTNGTYETIENYKYTHDSKGRVIKTVQDSSNGNEKFINTTEYFYE